MSLFVRPFVLTRLGCASAFILLAALVPAQAQSQTFTVTQPLLTLTGGSAFSTPNFNPTLGTLVDVTLTLKVDNKTFTIFDTNNASNNWVNLFMSLPGKTTKADCANIATWGNTPGSINLSYTKPASKTVASMGVAGLLLYCTPKNDAGKYIDINYTYDTGNPNNPNGGGNPATPEPAAKYLAVLAGGVMALLLVNRSRRQRLAAKRAGAPAELVLS